MAAVQRRFPRRLGQISRVLIEVMFVEPVPVDCLLKSVISVPGLVLAGVLVTASVFVEPVPVNRLLRPVVSGPGAVLAALLRRRLVPLLISLLILIFALILALVLSGCPNRESDGRRQSTRQKKRSQNTYADKHDRSLRVILTFFSECKCLGALELERVRKGCAES